MEVGARLRYYAFNRVSSRCSKTKQKDTSTIQVASCMVVRQGHRRFGHQLCFALAEKNAGVASFASKERTTESHRFYEGGALTYIGEDLEPENAGALKELCVSLQSIKTGLKQALTSSDSFLTSIRRRRHSRLRFGTVEILITT